jgi:ribosomal protein L11 methyltransferase
VRVPVERAEQARARLTDLAPGGWEEREREDGLELALYAPAGSAVRLAALGDLVEEPVAVGWEERWRAFHRPVRVGSLWVGPPWEPLPPGARPAIVIDPGRAFGTGAHPTTRLCLELLLERDPAGSAVDVGCGSGVLAIAAAKLGFHPVAALDSDPAAVEATRANAAANGVEVDARVADALEDPIPAAGLALANLELAAIPSLAGRLDARRLIASGFLASDALRLAGWRRLDRRELDGWAAELLEHA